MAPLTLVHGTYFLQLAPEAGGSISEFRHNDRPVLRSASPAAVAARDPLGMACFPMTPFVNRIRDGRFEFGGKRVQLAQAGIKHPLHGQGWRSPWQVTAAEASSATLEFEGGGDEWPWRYRSRQHFMLSSEGLAVLLEVENLSTSSMPASLGLHPYFPDIATASLRAKSSGCWEVDSELMPTGWQDTEGTPLFNAFVPLAGSRLDNCFTGFDGEATIIWSEGPGVRIVSQTCDFLQVYTRGNDGSFCVEAQTAMPDAMNLIGDPGAGTTVVEPGTTFSCLTLFQALPADG